MSLMHEQHCCHVCGLTNEAAGLRGWCIFAGFGPSHTSRNAKGYFFGTAKRCGFQTWSNGDDRLQNPFLIQCIGVPSAFSHV